MTPPVKPEPTTTPVGERRALVACILATVCLVVLAYVNTLRYGFVYDDSQILLSPLLHDPWNLSAVFDNQFAPLERALYRPLCDWSFLLNARVNEWITGSGDNAFGFHLVNVLLHAVASGLLLLWLRTLRLPLFVCALTAMLFAVHPLHSEVVTNIMGRSESMALAFGLAFLILHRKRRFVAASLCYLAALWSKESAIAFLPVAIVADRLFANGEWRRVLAPYAAYGVVAGVWLVLRARAPASPPTMPYWLIANPLAAATVGDRLMTAATIQLHYLRLLVAPMGQSTDYSFDQIPVLSTATPAVFLFVMLFVASLVAAWRFRRRAPEISLAVLGYASLFAITSNVLIPIGSIMAERLAYAPSAFFLVLVSSAMWRAGRVIGNRTAMGAAVLCALALTFLTVRQNRTWKDERTLFTDQVRTAPRSAKAYYNLGVVLGRENDVAGAIDAFEASIRMLPSYPPAHVCLANELLAIPDPATAVAQYREAIRCDPDDVRARVYLAHVLIDLGRIDEAAATLHEIEAREPRSFALTELRELYASAAASGARPKTDLDLARVLCNEHRYSGAIACLRRELERSALTSAERKEVLSLLALAHDGLGDKRQAQAFREEAARAPSEQSPASH